MSKLREIWQPVKHYEGLYEVSNLGNVRSLKRQTMGRWGKLKTTPSRDLKSEIGNAGYHRVHLCKEGLKKKYAVHRLVAEAFIPNDELLPCVNHIDAQKTNNRVDNLEWITYQDNTAHAMKTGRLTFTRNPTCIRGHLKTDGNVYIDRNGYPVCRACKRINNAKANQLREEQRNKLDGV